jgi:hypothetical protein
VPAGMYHDRDDCLPVGSEIDDVRSHKPPLYGCGARRATARTPIWHLQSSRIPSNWVVHCSLGMLGMMGTTGLSPVERASRCERQRVLLDANIGP